MLPASAAVTRSGGGWVPGSASQGLYPLLLCWALCRATAASCGCSSGAHPAASLLAGLWLSQPGPQYFCLWRRRDALGLGKEKGMFGYKRDQFEWKLIQFVRNSLNSSHSIPWPRPPFSNDMTCSVLPWVFLFLLFHHIFTDDFFPPYLYRWFHPLLERESRHIWC